MCYNPGEKGKTCYEVFSPGLCWSSHFLLMGSDPMEVSIHTIHPSMTLNQIHLSMHLYSLHDISFVREFFSFCFLIRRKITQVVRKKNVWPTLLYTKYLLSALQVLFSIEVKTGLRLVPLLSSFREEANEAPAKGLKTTSKSIIAAINHQLLKYVNWEWQH